MWHTQWAWVTCDLTNLGRREFNSTLHQSFHGFATRVPKQKHSRAKNPASSAGYTDANELLTKFCKLTKQQTIKNRFWLWLSVLWETLKLTRYQSKEFSFITLLYRTKGKSLRVQVVRADISVAIIEWGWVGNGEFCRSRRVLSTKTCRILHMLRKPNPIIALLLIQNIFFAQTCKPTRSHFALC